jgi:methionyl-tRNA synthetase
LLGYDAYLAGPIEIREHTEAGERSHEVLTGDYQSWVGQWGPGSLPPGQPLREPRPLFRKLDPAVVVSEELARMEAAAALA